jgi:transposase
VAVKQTEYDWVYLAAAVNPASGEALGLIEREMNTPVMDDLLANLGRRAAERNAHVVLVWDNAGFHTSRRLRVPANVTLLPLPPYAPELNPVERVWRHLRQTSLSNKAFTTHEHLEQEVTNACASLTPDTLRSICRTAWTERG